MLCLLLSCAPKPPRDPIQEIKDSGYIVFLTRNAPTTYYQGREETEGFEYELGCSFAAWLGVKPVFKILDSTTEILEGVEANQGHIAAAGLTRTPEREARFTFGPNYQTVRQQVVCRRGEGLPRHISHLLDQQITVVANSSYEERLQELQLEYPDLSWDVTRELEIEQIMEQVWAREIDCTVADSNIVAINRRYHPELEAPFSISGQQSLAWVLAPEYAALRPELEKWLLEMEQSWELDELLEQYYGYAQLFDYVDVKSFHRRIDQRLPRFKEDFQIAATRFGFSWTLLAAQAYQESHWDIYARSPTGVRGIMMLTRRTAKQVGVVDRLNPKESIMGGAKYMADLYARLPESIREPDRTWMTLASYNVGFGHLLDARTLAIDAGLDPNSWRSVQEMLPRLSKREYYKKVRYGYARGREPVRYVQRIRDFQNILERHLSNIELEESGSEVTELVDEEH